MTIKSLVHVNVNCSDFDRSLAFYELLGFRRAPIEIPSTNTVEVALAVGLPPYEIRAALLLLTSDEGSFMLDLIEWVKPNDPSPPYERLNHLGIARIALRTDDLDGDMERLEAEGVEFLSDPALVSLPGQPPTRFVCFKDPDGTILELVQ